MSRNNDYDFTKEMLNTVRKNRLLESEENNGNDSSNNTKKGDDGGDIIAITNDARFGQNVLTNQIDAFKSAVNNGAKFSKENSEESESNPLVYYPKTGNLVFSGSIPNLSNLKFQFSLNDITSSPYIFVDGLALTEETITTLNKLRGYYLNWKDEWLSSSDLLEKLKENDN